MRVHWLELENFRGVRRRRVAFDSGVTVVVGRNESGKSSMGEAIRLLLDTSLKPNSTHRRVRDVRPVDRDEDPLVRAEIETGPYRFVLTRCFGSGKRGAIELRIDAPHPEHKTGEDALARLEAILDETTDLELFHALTACQGQAVGGLTLPGSGWLQQALDETATETGHGEDERTSSLFDRVQREYARYFTNTGKENKDGTKLVDEMAQAQVHLANVTDKHTEFERKVDEVGRLRVRVANAEQKLPGEEKAADTRKADVEALGALERQCKTAEMKLDAARATDAHAAALARGRSQLVQEVSQATDTAEGAQTRVNELAEELAMREKALTAACANLDSARAATASLREEQQAYAADLERFDLLTRAQTLRLRGDRARELAAKLQEARKELARGVTGSSLQAIEDADRAHELARERMQVAAARLGIEALSPVRIEIDGESLHLEAGERIESRLDGPHELLLPGQVRVRLVGGTAQEELEASARQAFEALRSALDEADTASPAEARSRRELAIRAESEVRALTGRFDEEVAGVDAAPGESPIDALARNATELEERAAKMLAKRPASLPAPEDRGAAEDALSRAREAEQTVREVENAAADAENVARRAQEAARSAWANASGEAKHARETVSDRRARLNAARLADGPDDSIAEHLANSQKATDAATAEVQRLRSELDAKGLEELRLLADNARRAVEQRRRALESDRASLQELHGFLKAREAEGIGEILRDAKAEAECSSEARAAWTRRAAAARLLFETVRAHREATRAARVAPLTEGIESLGRIVFGQELRVRLDDDLRIVERTLGGTTLPFEHLSVGAREQLDLLMRIAAARAVAPKGGLPLILDDTLGNADPERLQRMNATIDLAGRDLQVLVLTCYPDRFDSIGTAARVDLDDPDQFSMSSSAP